MQVQGLPRPSTRRTIRGRRTTTPLHTQAASGGPHTSTSSSLHHYLPFIVPLSVPPSAPSSVNETSTVSQPHPTGKNLRPLFLRSQNLVSTLTTSSEAHRFIDTSTKKVVNIVLSPPADRGGIPKTIWIRSLELPLSLTNDQDSWAPKIVSPDVPQPNTLARRPGSATQSQGLASQGNSWATPSSWWQLIRHASVGARQPALLRPQRHNLW